MSKRIRLVLSICILTLCMCTLTFGVLAAVEKGNQIKGEIGFSADNCDVTISASISGAVKPDGSVNNPALSSQKVTDKLKWEIAEPLCFDESNYDEKNHAEIPNIVITFVVTNDSSLLALRVRAAVGDAIPLKHCSATFSSTVGTWSDENGILLDKNGGAQSSATITLTIKLTDKKTTLRPNPDYNQLVNFVFSTPEKA